MSRLEGVELVVWRDVFVLRTDSLNHLNQVLTSWVELEVTSARALVWDHILDGVDGLMSVAVIVLKLVRARAQLIIKVLVHFKYPSVFNFLIWD